MRGESPESGGDSGGGGTVADSVDPKLLEILVCPLTKGPLRYDRAAQELISEQARLAYPIREGIPIMLVDEARSLDD
ncbi:MAG: Trm112 family protein [Alphaproteobacteria bacterium]|nr:Trm112 family protein [Alphaproteobacteria bacterium]